MNGITKIACALLVVAALAGCKKEIDSTVLITGDSIMVNALGELTKQLLGSDEIGFLPVVNAVSGSAFAHPEAGAQYFSERTKLIVAKHRIDQVVVSWGINDAFSNTLADHFASAEAMAAWLDRQMQAFGSSRPVFWIEPHDNIAKAYPAAFADVRSTIRAGATRWPNLHILSYSGYVASKGLSLQNMLATDGVHLNQAGNIMLANMIRDTLIADAKARGLSQ